MGEIKEVRLPDGCGLPTDLVLTGGDTQNILVATSEGYLLLYEAKNWEAVLVTQACKGSIRKTFVHETLCFVSPTEGGLLLGKLEPESGRLRLAPVKASKEKHALSEEGPAEEVEGFKLGIVNTFAYNPRTNRLYLGMEDGDVHFCRLEIEGPSLQVLYTYDHHDDYISDLYLSSIRKVLLVASGDGTMSVVNTQKRALIASTKNFEEDISTLTYVSSNKIILGTSMGALKEFTWNYWGAPSGSIKAKVHGHASINKIVEVDNGASMVTAADDGCLRLCSLKPLGDQVQVMFEKKDDPIQELAFISATREGEGSIEHDMRGHVVCITSAEASLFVIPFPSPEPSSYKKTDKIGSLQVSGPSYDDGGSEEERIPKRKRKKARHANENPFPGLD